MPDMRLIPFVLRVGGLESYSEQGRFRASIQMVSNTGRVCLVVENHVE